MVYCVFRQNNEGAFLWGVYTEEGLAHKAAHCWHMINYPAEYFVSNEKLDPKFWENPALKAMIEAAEKYYEIPVDPS